MAVQGNLYNPMTDVISLKAGEAAGLVGKRVVTYDASASDFIYATTSTAAFGSFNTIQAPVGISVNNASAADGSFADVMCTVGKIVRVTCGGTVTAGQKVVAGTAGKISNAALTTAQMTQIVGIALETGSSDTEVAILFQPQLCFKET